MKIDRKKVKEIAKEISNDYVNHDAAQMLYEILPLIDELDIPDNFIFECIEAALDVRYETEFSTSTGFGIMVGQWLSEHCDPRKIYSQRELREAFRSAYRFSDWR